MKMRAVLCGLALTLVGQPAFADTIKIPEPPVAIYKPTPETVDELRAIQKHTKIILEKVIPCTVGLRVGNSTGSGVIVSKDGLILTAGHVSGNPGQSIGVVMHDGRVVKGITLGLNRLIDSGMVKITESGDWPYVDMGSSKDLELNQWVIATGQPGGPRPGRSPVVRLGRVGAATNMFVRSDCTLVGGDSGGPLFDMRGRVVGIHSRIEGSITGNVHVPVDTFKDTWDQLVKSVKIGESDVWLGVGRDYAVKEAKLESITPKSPAEAAGLKPGDIIVKFADKEVKTYEEMQKELLKKTPGDEVVIAVKRADKTVELKVKLGKRPS